MDAHLIVVNLCLIIIQTVTFLTVDASSSELRIHRELFQGYKTYARPVKNSSLPVSVEMSLVLRSVYNVEEKQQTLHSSVAIEMTWVDEFLSWNATAMGGIREILVPMKKIWSPTVCVENDVTNEKCFNRKSTVQIDANGKVCWWFNRELRTECDIDISKYPFDQQKCYINISNLYSSDKEIILKIDNSSSLITGQFVRNDEWELFGKFDDIVRFQIGPLNFTLLSFEFNLKRRGSFHVQSVIIPVCILTCLSLSCYFIPFSSGTKLTVSIEVFLAYALFLNSIFDTVPSFSRRPFILGLFMTSQLIFSAFTVIMMVVLSYLYQLNSEVPLPVRKLYAIINGSRIPSIRRRNRSQERRDSGDIQRGSIRSRACRGSGVYPKRSLSTSTSIRSKYSYHYDCSGNQSVNWIELAHTIEKRTFLVMLILNILCYLISVCILFN